MRPKIPKALAADERRSTRIKQLLSIGVDLRSSVASQVLLGRQAVDLPRAVALLAVAEPVVQAVFSPLPEFDFNGMDTIPSPIFGTRRIAARVLRGHLRITLFNYSVRRDR